MKLRPELEPKIATAEKLFPQIVELITIYDDGYDNDDREKIATAINQINSLTGKNITEDDLFEYWEGYSKEELALQFAIPEPVKVDNITKDELLEIMKRMQSFDDDGISETLSALGAPLSYILTYEYYSPLLEQNFSYPEPYGLFERQKINGNYIELTAEEIAEKIWTHKPIEL